MASSAEGDGDPKGRTRRIPVRSSFLPLPTTPEPKTRSSTPAQLLQSPFAEQGFTRLPSPAFSRYHSPVRSRSQLSFRSHSSISQSSSRSQSYSRCTCDSKIDKSLNEEDTQHHDSPDIQKKPEPSRPALHKFNCPLHASAPTRIPILNTATGEDATMTDKKKKKKHGRPGPKNSGGIVEPFVGTSASTPSPGPLLRSKIPTWSANHPEHPEPKVETPSTETEATPDAEGTPATVNQSAPAAQFTEASELKLSSPINDQPEISSTTPTQPQEKPKPPISDFNPFISSNAYKLSTTLGQTIFIPTKKARDEPIEPVAAESNKSFLDLLEAVSKANNRAAMLETDLEIAKQTLEFERRAVQNERDTFKAMSEECERLKTEKATLQEERDKLDKLDRECDGLIEEQNKEHEEFNELLESAKETERERDELVEERDEKQQSIDDFQAERRWLSDRLGLDWEIVGPYRTIIGAAITALEDEKKEFADKIAKLEGDTKAEQDITSLNDEKARLEGENMADQALRDSLKEAIERLEQQLNDAREATARSEDNYNRLNASYESLEQRADRWKTDAGEQLRLREEAEKKLTEQTAKNNQQELHIESIEEQLQESLTKCEELERSGNANNRRELTRCRAEKETMTKTAEGLQRNTEALQGEVDRQRTQIRQLQREKAEVEQELGAAQNAMTNMEEDFWQNEVVAADHQRRLQEQITELKHDADTRMDITANGYPGTTEAGPRRANRRTLEDDLAGSEVGVDGSVFESDGIREGSSSGDNGVGELPYHDDVGSASDGDDNIIAPPNDDGFYADYEEPKPVRQPRQPEEGNRERSPTPESEASESLPEDPERPEQEVEEVVPEPEKIQIEPEVESKPEERPTPNPEEPKTETKHEVVTTVESFNYPAALVALSNNPLETIFAPERAFITLMYRGARAAFGNAGVEPSQPSLTQAQRLITTQRLLQQTQTAINGLARSRQADMFAERAARRTDSSASQGNGNRQPFGGAMMNQVRRQNDVPGGTSNRPPPPQIRSIFNPVSMSSADGRDSDGKTRQAKIYIAIKGSVYDVTGRFEFVPGGVYAAVAGKDASRAFALGQFEGDAIAYPEGPRGPLHTGYDLTQEQLERLNQTERDLQLGERIGEFMSVWDSRTNAMPQNTYLTAAESEFIANDERDIPDFNQAGSENSFQAFIDEQRRVVGGQPAIQKPNNPDFDPDFVPPPPGFQAPFGPGGGPSQLPRPRPKGDGIDDDTPGGTPGGQNQEHATPFPDVTIIGPESFFDIANAETPPVIPTLLAMAMHLLVYYLIYLCWQISRERSLWVGANEIVRWETWRVLGERAGGLRRDGVSWGVGGRSFAGCGLIDWIFGDDGARMIQSILWMIFMYLGVLDVESYGLPG